MAVPICTRFSRRRLLTWLSIALLIVAATAGPGGDRVAYAQGQQPEPLSDDTFIVRASPANIEAVATRHGLTVIRRVNDQLDLFLVRRSSQPPGGFAPMTSRQRSRLRCPIRPGRRGCRTERDRRHARGYARHRVEPLDGRNPRFARQPHDGRVLRATGVAWLCQPACGRRDSPGRHACRVRNRQRHCRGHRHRRRSESSVVAGRARARLRLHQRHARQCVGMERPRSLNRRNSRSLDGRDPRLRRPPRCR